jgi:Asp/Glu/hydantoin racemase
MAEKIGHRKGINILVINPNSSKALTKGLEKMINGLEYPEVCTIFTLAVGLSPKYSYMDAMDYVKCVRYSC